MEWHDVGIVLAARRHGETSAVVSLLTAEHGRHAGLVRGGATSRARGVYQAGNEVTARWRARLAEHLGTYTCEPLRARAAALLEDPLRLAGLTAACAIAEAALPERYAYPALYRRFVALLDALESDAHWPEVYARWELDLLGELGFGLDLSCCAVTGQAEDLAFVSPRSGRAVSAAAGAAYREKLLPLPHFLLADGPAKEGEIGAALKLTGWFLEHHLLADQGGRAPPARDRLIARLSR